MEVGVLALAVAVGSAIWVLSRPATNEKRVYETGMEELKVILRRRADLAMWHLKEAEKEVKAVRDSLEVIDS